MKVSISMDDFPIKLCERFINELHKYIPSASIEVGGENTVFVNFATADVVRAQEAVIICDKYHFGGDSGDGGEILCGDED